MQPGSEQRYYFVLTDRFANGDPRNDRGGIAGGRDAHGFDPTAISHYHGGDLAGLTAQLDYLEGLGITAIWLTPPFKNKAVQSGTAGYHGYWITDFLTIDPHLGTNAEFRAFVAAAHARGIRVFMDVILNHTADVIVPRSGDVTYRPVATWPYRDAAGQPFDAAARAWNGLGAPHPWPALAAETSFATVPTVPAPEAQVKVPAWLNDVRYYHNRGNTTFRGPDSLDGDFVGLDDLFTEHPDVVRGLNEIYAHWVREYSVDGFRIDTAKHTNLELWQAFGPAMQEAARTREAGTRSEFFAFGEVSTDDTDTTLLSEFTTLGTLGGALDFALATAARDFVGRGGSAQTLARLFTQDDHYTDHDSSAHALPTFLGNHDQGRFAYFLQRYDPAADRAQLLARSRLGHALLFLVRGQPVLYYGDEQGMIGRGGWDMQARESMFAAQAPDFREATLLGTTRTGADDKFDPDHPLYRQVAELSALRGAHPALARGAMLVRETEDPQVFAFSRVERSERIEYVAALNNHRDAARRVRVPTSQPPGTVFRCVYALGPTRQELKNTLAVTSPDGALPLQVPALGAVVWQAERPLPAAREDVRPLAVAFAAPNGAAGLTFATRELDGQAVAERHEIAVEVRGGDGVTEVTFLLERSSRPGCYDYLGTDDAPPYRVFWRPPADFIAGETVNFFATADDLRGQRAGAELREVRVNLPLARSGIAGASAPRFTRQPEARRQAGADQLVVLEAEATGTPAPRYQWFRDGTAVPGATAPTLALPSAATGANTAGRYTVLATNIAGAAVSAEVQVEGP